MSAVRQFIGFFIALIVLFLSPDGVVAETGTAKPPQMFAQVGVSRTWSTEVNGSGRADVDSRTGFRGGLGVFLHRGEAMSALLLVSYEQRAVRSRWSGEWFELSTGQPLTGVWTHDVEMSYVTTSLLARYSPVRTPVRPFIAAGPEFGIPLSAQDRLRRESGEFISERQYDILGGVQIPDVAIRVDLGVELPLGRLLVSPTATYTNGLTTIRGDDERLDGVVTGLGEARHRVLSFSVSFGGRPSL
jgi:hypothetical protein